MTNSSDLASAAPTRAISIADSLTHRQWDELVDVVVRRLERRTLDDLARRGRRHLPGVM